MIACGFPSHLLSCFALDEQQDYIAELQKAIMEYEIIQNKIDTIFVNINRYGVLSDSLFFMGKNED